MRLPPGLLRSRVPLVRLPPGLPRSRVPLVRLPPGLPWSRPPLVVRAANQRGHTLMLEIVAMLLGTYVDSENPEHTARREKLLAPLIEQVELTRQARRARRSRGPGALPAGDAPAGQDDDLDDDLGDDLGDSTVAVDSEPAPATAR